MKRIIVGLHGTTGAGKDTVAEHMGRKHQFRVVAFADEVKSDLISIFDVSPRLFSDRRLEVEATDKLSLGRCNHPDLTSWFLSTATGEMEAAHMGAVVLMLPRSPRWLIQMYGTDYCRAANPNYWIDRLAMRIDEFAPTDNIVISDVRFQNEAEFVKFDEPGNEIWEIIRMNNPHHNKTDKHVSNGRLPAVDKVLFNSGTINQLWRKVDRAVEKVL